MLFFDSVNGKPSSFVPAAWVAALLLAGCAAPRPAAPLPPRAAGFVGLEDFTRFTRQAGTNPGEMVLLSPPIPAPVAWNELIVSWNTAPGDHLTVEARSLGPNGPTRFYTLGQWADDPARHPRGSVARQADADGAVRTDTLALQHPGGSVQLRLTLGAEAGRSPHLKFVGLSFADRRTPPLPFAGNPAARGRVLPVPELRQGDYPEEKGWCSPTSLAMVLAYWGNQLHRPDLRLPVPTVAQAVYDPVFDGTGNWPFNTAFAGEFPGLRAYVTRMDDLAELEDWIALGVPPILSVSSYLTNNRQVGRDNGHLIVCAGFTTNGDFIANDPGVSVRRNESPRRVYPRDRLLAAWRKSGRAVYLVYPESLGPPRPRAALAPLPNPPP